MLLVVLVAASLASLASGARATLLARAVEAATTTVAHPFWVAFRAVDRLQDYVTDFVFRYQETRQEVEVMRTALAGMMERARDRGELVAENERLRGMLDFVRHEPRLTLEPAHIIARAEGQGTLIIDRGAIHGVERSMCVITPDGIAGVVAEVNPLNSIVFTVHHVNFKIGAMVRRSRVRGSVHGSGSSFARHLCTLRYLDAKDDVRVGDEVVTSGESLYPSGYLIGRISDVQNKGYLLRTAVVEPAVDPFRLDEVFLVRRAQPRVEELTGVPEGSLPEFPAASLPESPSLQERFAP